MQRSIEIGGGRDGVYRVGFVRDHTHAVRPVEVRLLWEDLGEFLLDQDA